MDEREQTTPDAPVAPAPAPGQGPTPDAPADPRRGTMSMADYEEAMTDRNVHARKRGLSAPYIPGGRDPDPESGLAQERFYLRLLGLMVAVIVLGGLLLSIVAYIVTGGAGFGA